MPSRSSTRKRALISVSDKTGVEKLAKGLQKLGYEILSTGGTHKILEKNGIAVTSVDHVTQFPECFGGRVKTMHPLIMGGILYKRGDEKHCEEAKKLGIEPIDIVVVNLYPFAQTLKKVTGGTWSISHADDPAFDVHHPEIVEQIDIGGPTLLRSAAKNHADVLSICDPFDYDRVLAALESGEVADALRRELAAKVFLHTAAYDALIAEYLSKGEHNGVMLTSGRTLRYGENPHQWGKFYAQLDARSTTDRGEHRWKLLQGKELSYLNIFDSDAAWRMVQEFSRPAAVLVKHANPSGIAVHDTLDEAFQRAYDSDRLSAFGVIIALNKRCTSGVVQKMLDQKIFTEILLAPGFEPGALELLKQKPNLRVIDMTDVTFAHDSVYRSAFGGMLVQNDDLKQVTKDMLTCVTKKKPTPEQIDDLLFAWKVVKHAKSNAIVFAHHGVTVGLGCGQTSRVDSAWIAAKRAGDKAKGAVMASDAFFPFPDAVEEAVKNGIVAIIQPGGSVRDADVIKRADELGVTMVTTGVRGFRH